jgi:hypothetical protein
MFDGFRRSRAGCLPGPRSGRPSELARDARIARGVRLQPDNVAWIDGQARAARDAFNAPSAADRTTLLTGLRAP